MATDINLPAILALLQRQQQQLAASVLASMAKTIAIPAHFQSGSAAAKQFQSQQAGAMGRSPGAAGQMLQARHAGTVQLGIDALKKEELSARDALAAVRALSDALSDPAGEAALVRQASLMQKVAQETERAETVRRRILGIPEPGSKEAARKAVLDQYTAEGEAIDKARTKAKALAILYASPAGAKMLEDRRKALRGLEVEEERAARLRRRAQVGGPTESFEHAAKKLGEMQGVLDSVGNKAALVFGSMTAGISGFVASASPAHFQTLTGSIQLLGASIGNAFLPYIKDMSRWVQDAATWVRNLDDATKSNIVKIAMWTAGLAGLVMVGAKVVAMVSGILGQLARLGAFLAGPFLSAGVALNPWVAALLGLAAVVGAVATAFAVLGDEAEEAGGAIEGVSKKKLQHESDVGSRRTLSDEDRKQIQEALDKGENLQDTYKKIRDKYEIEIKKLEKETAEGEGAKRSLGASQTLQDLQTGKINKFEALKELGEVYGEDLGKFKYQLGTAFDPKDYLKKLVAELEKTHGGGDLGEARRRKEAAETLLKKTHGEDPLKISTAGLLGQPSIGTAAAYGESLQLRAASMLGEGDLQAELQKQTLEALKQLLGADGLSKDVKDVAKEIRRVVPPWRP